MNNPKPNQTNIITENRVVVMGGGGLRRKTNWIKGINYMVMKEKINFW